jgi:2-methylisocitrate lyase-like PEP mutase family enzyme
MNGRRALRSLVERKQGLVVPGAYDAVSAKLIERAGFPAVYMTGYGTSASRLGLPDLGFAGLAEMADHARNLAAAVGIPLIADADTGYGNALSVRRTVQMYEAAGVAALHIEDQVAPKRCGHLSGHQIVPRAEFAGKIRAAVEARRDPDLLVIARTDAISAESFDEALRRGEAAVEAGADMLFIEAPRSEAQVAQVAEAFDTPLLYNYAPGGRSPLLPFARLRELGYAIILLPVDTLFVAVKAIADFLRDLKAGDDVLRLADRYVPFREFNELIGVTRHLELAERYDSTSGGATAGSERRGDAPSRSPARHPPTVSPGGDTFTSSDQA